MRPRLCGLYCAAKVGIAALILVNCVLLLVNAIYVFNRAVLEARITLLRDETRMLEQLATLTTPTATAQERTVPNGLPLERPAPAPAAVPQQSTKSLILFPSWNGLNVKQPPARKLGVGLGVGITLRSGVKVNEHFLRNFSNVTNVTLCDGKVQLFADAFVRLRNVTLNTALLSGPTGGEPLQSVLNRPEADEYLHLGVGTFGVACSMPQTLDSLRTKFGVRNSLSKFVYALDVAPLQRASASGSAMQERRVTLVLTRFEYVNLCHSMTYFYNAFIMARFFGLPPQDLDVLLVDAHPAGALDDVWADLFGNTLRIGALARNSSTLFADMIWMLQGYDSPLLQHRAQIAPPLLEEFRQFVLHSYAVATRERADCAQLKVTLVLRRNYVAHPRNPTGRILRKIANEQELIAALQTHAALQGRVVVTPVQLETLNFTEQLRLAADTDVLLGMHGAGLAHVLFLPQHGALVELFPRFFPASARFPAFARWRKMHYFMWKNERIATRTRTRQELESCIVDVQEVAKRVASAVQKICGL